MTNISRKPAPAASFLCLPSVTKRWFMSQLNDQHLSYVKFLKQKAAFLNLADCKK
ncbi:hypothetical protein FC24_GL002097 [Loigolactobacillus rennini DSM 20253]|uniref:Uncharacterized protein n=1 Tax=Loigolactobacillus rennini DSM 20253 TaxID=1423796 RepID=A0A0R2D5S7_9LACO|nr:hypothetical protein FC24_GL002097 [Loigolactobacillus rennini DSM 20253]